MGPRAPPRRRGIGRAERTSDMLSRLPLSPIARGVAKANPTLQGAQLDDALKKES